MLSAAALQPPRCLLCRFRIPTPVSALTTRTYRTLNRTKAPARLQLSRRVAEPRATAAAATEKAKKKKEGKTDISKWQLNRTRVPPSLAGSIAADSARRAQTTTLTDKDGKSGGKDKKYPDGPPTKKMKMRSMLHEISVHHKVDVKKRIEDLNSFDDLGLLPEVVEAAKSEILNGLDVMEPTPAQRVAIPAILGKEGGKKKGVAVEEGQRQFLIAAETGSGKTLAYALPVMDFVKRAEKKAKFEEEGRKNKMLEENDGLEIPQVEEFEKNCKPKAVILLPTTELVVQVGSIIKKLAHVVKLRTTYITRDMTGKVIRNKLFSAPLDVLVSTPHLLQSISQSDPKFFALTTDFVVDEADSLFDKSFSPLTNGLIEKAYNLQRLILCSATIPKSLDNRLREMYPSIRRLVTPNLHSIPRRVQLSVVDASERLYAGNKQLALADTLSHLAKDGSDPGFTKMVIVFVNEREHAAPIADFLVSKGVDAVALERDASARKESNILELFSGPKVPADPKARYPMKVLVTTDITSRGIDTRNVKTVVLYDDPHSTIDFIHRIGRAGRMGRRGRAIIIVDKNTDKQWVKEIRVSMHMGASLV